MIEKLDQLDKYLSKKIHYCDSKLLTSILYPFARIFNPQFIIIPISFMTSMCFTKGELLPLKQTHLLRLIPAIYYVIALLFNLVLTLVLKKKLNRPRPIPPKEGYFKNKTNKLRGGEHNCSLPSGDSAQGAVFAVSFYFLVQSLSVIKKDEAIYCYFVASLVIFVLMIMLARIYFMCHYIGDTIMGACVSGAITFFAFQPVYEILVKQIIQATFG